MLYRTVVLSVLSCLSVTLVYCDQTVARIKMKLGTRYAGRPRPWLHCVRWGPSSPSPKGAQPLIFGPCPLWPNGWMDQDGTWHGDGPLSRPHCARSGPSSSSPKRGQSPQFSARIYCGDGWIDQDGTWYGGMPRPRRHCIDGDPVVAPPRKGEHPRNFRPMCIGAKRLYASGYYGTDVSFSLGDIVFDWDIPLPIFGPCILWPNGWMDEDATW